jgi:hypothetical protein
MHRWSFQRLVMWLIPSLVYGIALCALVLEQKQTGAARGLLFSSDDAYRIMAAARVLATRFQYALQPNAPMTAVRNVLPAGAVAVLGRALNNYPAAMVMLGAVMGWGALLLHLRMARELFPFSPFVLYSALLLIVSPGFLIGAIGGDAVMWAIALMSTAVAFHIEGLVGRRNPLCRLVIVPVGLLAMIRVEFAAIWLLLAAHAWLTSVLERRGDGTTGYVSVRFFTGLFVLSLFIAPLLAWNLRVIRVPWPQMPGVPMTAEAWAASSFPEAFAQYRAYASEGTRLAFRALAETPWMQGRLERYLTWIGAFFLAALAFFRKDERPFSVIPWLLVGAPLLLGVVYPMTGAASFPVVLGALQPAAVLAASFFVFRIPFLIEGVYRKLKPGLPEAPGFQIWWSLAGGLLILTALVHMVGLVSRHVQAVQSAQAVREQLRSFCLEQHPKGAPLATDVPGWLAYTVEVALVDITGEGTPEILSCLNPNGRYNAAALKDFLREKSVETVVLWESSWFEPDRDYEVQSVAWPAGMPLSQRLPQVYDLKAPGVL